MNCTHCSHDWDRHIHRVGELLRCDCGCMWPDPSKAAKSPPPPTERELRIARVEDVIWSELERQSDEGMGPYVDREMDMVDASGAGLNMTDVADAVLNAIENGAI